MQENLIAQWKKDEQAHFEGWNFSYLKDRIIEEKPDWDYGKRAKELIEYAGSVLDIATGGGEKLATLGPFDGKKIVAMEGYKPNVAVAKKNLSPLHIEVIYKNETDTFPFANDSFDLVLNRHGGLNMPEIVRVLKKNGCFLTQQVSGDNHIDLLQFFKEHPKWLKNNLKEVKKELENLGMSIKEAKEWTGKTTFKDVGALVYYLKSIPWTIDNFSVDNHLPYLEKLQNEIEKSGQISFISARFFVLAEK